MPNYYLPFNFDDALREAASRNHQREIERVERNRKMDIALKSAIQQLKNQRAAVQTKRHKQKNIHAQATKEVPKFLKQLTKKLED